MVTQDRVELGYYADKEHEEKMRELVIQQRRGLTPRTIFMVDSTGRSVKFAVYPQSGTDQLDPWSLDDAEAVFTPSALSLTDCVAIRNAVVSFEAKLFLRKMLQSKAE
jgi:hypothetical protein